MKVSLFLIISMRNSSWSPSGIVIILVIVRVIIWLKLPGGIGRSDAQEVL